MPNTNALQLLYGLRLEGLGAPLEPVKTCGASVDCACRFADGRDECTAGYREVLDVSMEI
jgi:hypothetical protein